VETLQAVLAIVLIDLALSGDNALVIGILERYPRAIWLGALALIWTAAELILDEPALRVRDAIPWSAELVLTAVLMGIIVATSRVRIRGGAAVD